MNDKTTDVHPLAQRLNDEMLEALDEELELELDDDRLDAAVEHITGRQPKETIDRDTYFRELLRLQRELIRLQDWVVHQKLKLVVLFEGRDAAGKGGAIKCVAEPLPSWVVHSLDLIQVGKDLQWTKQRQCRNRNRPSRVGGASSR